MGMLQNTTILGGKKFVDNVFGDGGSAGYKKLLQAMEQSKAYFKPYYDTGVASLGKYSGALDSMADPQAYYNGIMDDYNTSPAARFRMDEGVRGLEREASATGMLGSGGLRKDVIDYTQGVIGQDQQQYLNNILGILGTYLNGESSLASTGFNAGSNLASITQGMGQARLNQQTSESGAMNKLLGMLMQGGADYATGGATAVMRPYSSSINQVGWLNNGGR